MAALTRLDGKIFRERRHHATERAVDERRRFDEASAIRAEAVGKLLGIHGERLQPLPVGEQVGAAERADPRELRELQLAVVGFELDPGAALEILRDLEELVLDGLVLL